MRVYNLAFESQFRRPQFEEKDEFPLQFDLELGDPKACCLCGKRRCNCTEQCVLCKKREKATVYSYLLEKNIEVHVSCDVCDKEPICERCYKSDMCKH